MSGHLDDASLSVRPSEVIGGLTSRLITLGAIGAIGLAVGFRLVPLVDKASGGDLLQRIRGVRRKLIGFEMVDRGIARHGYDVYIGDAKCGIVTSGTQTVSQAFTMKVSLLGLLDPNIPDISVGVPFSHQFTPINNTGTSSRTASQTCFDGALRLTDGLTCARLKRLSVVVATADISGASSAVRPPVHPPANRSIRHRG